MKYQIVVLGPEKDQFLSVFTEELSGRIDDIGLNSSSDVEILGPDAAHEIAWDGTPVGVWFGGTETSDQTDLDVLGKLLQETAPVLPVVNNLDHYQQLVPEVLHRINGHVWESADSTRDRIGGPRLITNILAILRLARAQRQALISYKRSDARGVAAQLFDKLSQRGYRPFLDMWSVESGVDFQNILWERMADLDLLIFLDSPNALTSRWVHEELARAHDVGLGVLQLVWPNHQRTRGTEFSDWIQLETSDFSRQTAGLDDILTDHTVAEVVAATERSRIRSLRARRLRVVTDLVDQAQDIGIEAAVLPVGPVVLYRSGSKVGRVFPFVGLPDALAIQQVEKSLLIEEVLPVRIIYSGLGIGVDWADHLEWLNGHNPTLSHWKSITHRIGGQGVVLR